MLEIGFGGGRMLAEFLRKGHRVHGIEAGYLETHTDDLLKKYGHLQAGKIEEIRLPAEKFDLIYGIHVIEHLDDPSDVFKKCHNALKNEGVIYFITPNARSMGLTIFRDTWWNLEDPGHRRFFSPRSIHIMLLEAGFSGTEIRIPLWDSVTVEINSILRAFRSHSREHGILEEKYSKLVDVFLLPFSMVLRIFLPRLSPSLEVIARKSPGCRIRGN